MMWVEAWGSALTETYGPCALCGGPTNTLEPNFEARLHVGACTVELWREYVDALDNGDADAADVWRRWDDDEPEWIVDVPTGWRL